MSEKIINPWTEKINNIDYNVFIKIAYTNGKLSLTGVVGPYRSGNCAGSCGQIIMDFKEYDNRGFMSLDDITPATGWDRAMIKTLLDIWDKWHLNDMQSACEHQRALGWTYEDHRGMYVEKHKKHPRYLIDEYDNGEDHDLYIIFDEFKGHLCPVCGYSIGSAWLFEPVPDDVITQLSNMPDTTIRPAWV